MARPRFLLLCTLLKAPFQSTSPSTIAISSCESIKNPAELEGLRKAHIRDGAAVVQYLAWLDSQMQEIYGAAGYFVEPDETRKRKHMDIEKLTEVSASDKLEGFRARQEHFKGLSIPTISYVGANAAIIHYSPQPQTCRNLILTAYICLTLEHSSSKIILLWTLPDFPREQQFAGYTLDILARLPLWKDGLDYRHGTVHRIGSYLNVREGPHQISFRPHANNALFEPSMTVTNEPGYYEDGNFGIRLENVLIVKEADTKFNFGEKGYLSFEHITWAPYQRKLMDLSLLTPEEVEWVNTYHSNCRDVLAPDMDELEMAWLRKATEPIRS